jgi:hypothetical protein
MTAEKKKNDYLLERTNPETFKVWLVEEIK